MQFVREHQARTTRLLVRNSILPAAVWPVSRVLAFFSSLPFCLNVLCPFVGMCTYGECILEIPRFGSVSAHFRRQTNVRAARRAKLASCKRYRVNVLTVHVGCDPCLHSG